MKINETCTKRINIFENYITAILDEQLLYQGIDYYLHSEVTETLKEPTHIDLRALRSELVIYYYTKENENK